MFFSKDSDNFRLRQSEFCNFWHLLLNWRQDFFLRNRLVVLGLKEGLVECATVSIKRVGLCFLTSLFDHHGRWWFLTYLKPSGGVSSPLSYKLLCTAGVSSPSHEKLSVLGDITLRFITGYDKFYWCWSTCSTSVLMISYEIDHVLLENH